MPDTNRNRLRKALSRLKHRWMADGAANNELAAQHAPMHASEIEAGSIGIIYFDTAYKAKAFNPLAVQFFGKISAAKLQYNTDISFLLDNQTENAFYKKVQNVKLEALGCFFLELKNTGTGGVYYRVCIEKLQGAGNAVYHTLLIEDATQLYKTQTNLELLQLVTQSVDGIISITDHTGRILYTNLQFTKITGYRFSEVWNRTHNVLKSGFHPAIFYREMWKKLMAGREWKGMVRNKRKDGSLYWEQVTIIPYQNKEGMLYFLKMAQEVKEETQNKNHNNQVLEIQSRVFHELPVGMAIVNMHHQLVVHNQALSNMLQVTEAPVIEFTLQNWLEAYQPKPGVHNRLKHTFADGYVHNFELLITHVNIGTETLILLQVNKENAPGLIISDNAGTTDNWLQVASHFTCMWMWNTETGMVHLSGPWYKLLGFAHAALLPAAMPIDQFIHGTDLAYLRNLTIDTPTQRGNGFEHEVRISTAAGTYEWFLLKGTLQPPAANQHAIHLVGICTDISFMKQNQERLEHARETAENANLMKTEFLANMSHEIRSPMSAILGYSEILKDKIPAHSENRIYLDGILSAGHNLMALLNDVLNLARLEAGNLELTLNDVKLHPLLSKISNDIQKQAEAKNIGFIINLHESLNAFYQADERYITKLIQTLAENAVKFTEKGYVSMQARMLPYKNDNWLVVRIKDTGVGIRAEKIPYLFEPFDTANQNSPARFDNVGMGLAITKHLTERMNGYITLRSNKGSGSMFVIHIPLAPSDMSINSTAKPAAPLQADDIQGTIRILIADDVESNRNILFEFLSGMNVEIQEATNGRDAVKIAYNFKPHVVLFDYNMPQLSGTDAVRLIRKINHLQEIKAVIVTGKEHGKSSELNEIQAQLLVKPYTKMQVQALMSQLFPQLAQPTENQTSLPAKIVLTPSDTQWLKLILPQFETAADTFILDNFEALAARMVSVMQQIPDKNLERNFQHLQRQISTLNIEGLYEYVNTMQHELQKLQLIGSN